MPPSESTSRLVVIGVGNAYRGDDAAGLEIARRVRAAGLGDVVVQECIGDVLELLDMWQTGDRVVLIDAVLSGARAGEVFRIDAVVDTIPRELRSPVSSHGVGVPEGVALARALERLPETLIVYAVEGQTFDPGVGLSASVEAVLDGTAERIVDELEALGARRGRPD